jgi:hypothetical protein
MKVFIRFTYLCTGIRSTVIRVTHMTAGTCGSTGTAGAAPRVASQTLSPAVVESVDARETRAAVVRCTSLAGQAAPLRSRSRCIQVVGAISRAAHDQAVSGVEEYVSRVAAVAPIWVSHAGPALRTTIDAVRITIPVLILNAVPSAVGELSEEVASHAPQAPAAAD